MVEGPRGFLGYHGPTPGYSGLVKRLGQVVRLRVREKPLVREPHRLTDLLHRLFSKRRKQIGTILGRSAALPAGVDPQQRPEQLSVELLVAMADAGL